MVDAAENLLGACRRDASYYPVRREGVGDGRAFAQELGVPGQFGQASVLREPLREIPGGAHRHGGFPGDQTGAPHERRERLDGAVYLREVSTAAFRLLRRAGADEMHIAKG